jgi:predicted Zn-dependent peptidase
MIEFEKFELDNGLKVIVHQDKTTPIVAINIVYNVGARNESANKTGFAHLFEHLMFGGSINITNYDAPLQMVGGENNAFTNNDITNYYITLPKENIETGFWLESDRMLSLAFSEKSLEVQRNVVIEEFKQRYLNQPYGDIYLLLRPLAYKKHPYQWATIGKEISHIENATMQDVKDFFYAHYAPNNAVLSVVGNITAKEIKPLVEKYFGDIEKRKIAESNIPKEPKQTEPRKLTVKRDVPNDTIYKAYHMCARMDKDYHASDLLSDVLSNGDSSRLTRKLIKEQKLFLELSAYIMGSRDEGLFIISGKPNDGVNIKDAEKAIDKEINLLIKEGVNEQELQKVKNKVESSLIFAQMNILNKAMNLGIAEILNDANDVNTEIDKYLKVKTKDIVRVAKQILNPNNCSTLYYLSEKK